MVWSGRKLHGMVWSCNKWYKVVYDVIKWYGTVLTGMEWPGMVWNGMECNTRQIDTFMGILPCIKHQEKKASNSWTSGLAFRPAAKFLPPEQRCSKVVKDNLPLHIKRSLKKVFTIGSILFYFCYSAHSWCRSAHEKSRRTHAT